MLLARARRIFQIAEGPPLYHWIYNIPLQFAQSCRGWPHPPATDVFFVYIYGGIGVCVALWAQRAHEPASFMIHKPPPDSHS